MNGVWTEEHTKRLRELLAKGASVARASAALRTTPQALRRKARELGIPFPTVHERKRLQLEKEAAARSAAGLSSVDDELRRGPAVENLTFRRKRRASPDAAG